MNPDILLLPYSHAPTLRHFRHSDTPPPRHSDTPIHPYSDTSSHGVALVLVLGILTIMMLMGVAFSVSMRTERVAAGNYADIVRARQMVHVGLARAIDQIQTNMMTNLFNPAGRMYPSWSVTNSYSTNEALPVSNVNFLAGEASNFVPRALWQDAADANWLERSKHWIEIRYEATNGLGEIIESYLVGRVAYMVINCSGLLDANFAGGAAVRALGTNPNEIAIGELDEIGSEAAFLNERTSDVRYETSHELGALNSELSPPTNFFIYSYFPAGYWTNDGGGGVGISTGICIVGLDKLELVARKTGITNAFRQAGLTDAGATDLLFSNLIHYVDTDFDLNDVIDQAYVEHVPMINEIVVSNVVDVQEDVPGPGTNTYTITCYVTFELWNPFVEDVIYPYHLHYNLTFIPISTPNNVVPADVLDKQVTLESSPMTFPRESFYVTNETCIATSSVAGTFGNISFDVSVLPTIWRGFPGDPDYKRVDGLNQVAVFNVDNSELTPTNYSVFTKSIECLDPRFNWDPSLAGGQWRTNAVSHTLGATNTWTASYLDPTVNDGDTAMYVANSNLTSVGELGYLVYAPWKTIKLYGPNRHTVLDTFTFSTNTASRGLINPNSTVTDVLAAAFAEMPVDSYPYEPSSSSNSMTVARTVADRVISGGPYTNLSDVYRVFTNFTGLSANTELEKESFIRNAAGLFGARQNLFTIIIEVHAASGKFIPRNPAKQRAVAVVWRDPYTGECFVRSIKWLED